MSSELPHSLTLTIPFLTPDLAHIAQRTLSVDSELSSPSELTRQLTVTDSSLVAHFDSQSLRKLRVTVNGFLDSLTLITETIKHH